MNKVSWMLSGVIAAIVVGFGTQTFATTESIWLGASGSLQKEIIQSSVTDSSSNKYCTNTQKFELEYKTILSQRLYSTKKPLNECWFQTKYGAVADTTGGYLYIQSFKGANVVRVNDSTRQRWHPLPGSSSIALSMNNGTSFFYNLYIVDDVASKLTLREDGSRDLYYLDRLDAWRLKSPDGNPMSVNAVGISANGAWMAVESPSGFLRINVETKEIKKFENKLHTYGIGANPSYGLTMSNDGRYVILNGGPMGTVSTNLYDLDRCVDDNGQYVSNVVQCEKLDLVAAVSTAGTRQHTKRPIFSDDATNITLDIKNGTQYDRYSVAAPGHALYGMEYLALGDSYTSGEGDGDGKSYYLPGTDGDGESIPLFATSIDDYPYAVEKCHLSTRSYPYLLARAAGLADQDFRSVACSGADMNDVGNDIEVGDRSTFLNGHFNHMEFLTIPQLLQVKKNATDNFIPGRTAQIDFVKRYKPRVITIGISGNDINFSGKLQECLLSVVLDCRYATTDRGEIVNEMEHSVYYPLSQLLSKLRQASPASQIFVIGYPQLVGVDACNLNVQLSSIEREFVREAVMYMNDTMAAAAARAGVNYIDIEHSLDGNNLCSGIPYPAINGLTVGNDIAWILGNESYHPNEIGHSLVQETIHDSLGGTLAENKLCPADYKHCNTSSANLPSVPPYFQSQVLSQHIIQRMNIVSSAARDFVKRGTILSVHAAPYSLLPGSTVTVVLKSQERVLTPVPIAVMPDGTMSVNVMIPSDVEPGIHTIHIIGKNNVGEPIDYYQTVGIAASETDKDGDGIPDDVDVCLFVQPSGVDEDKDGIDDACDGRYTPPILPPPSVEDPEHIDDEVSTPSPTEQQPAAAQTRSSTQQTTAETTIPISPTQYSGPIVYTASMRGSEAQSRVTDQKVLAADVQINDDQYTNSPKANLKEIQGYSISHWLYLGLGLVIAVVSGGIIISRLQKH